MSAHAESWDGIWNEAEARAQGLSPADVALLPRPEVVAFRQRNTRVGTVALTAAAFAVLAVSAFAAEPTPPARAGTAQARVAPPLIEPTGTGATRVVLPASGGGKAVALTFGPRDGQASRYAVVSVEPLD